MNEKGTIVVLVGVNNIIDTSAILAAIESGFDLNTRDSDGRTLLMEAVIYRNYELMRVLISKEADVDSSDRRGWAALHFAAQNYDAIATSALIVAGADVNSQDAFQNSVLSTAVLNSKGQGDVIGLLISSGADKKVKNLSGISAEDLAKTISNYDLLPFLED
jgi:uncharacterized protein